MVSVDVSIRWNLSMQIPSTLDATYVAQNFVSELVSELCISKLKKLKIFDEGDFSSI
jgi:hypothetical protein